MTMVESIRYLGVAEAFLGTFATVPHVWPIYARRVRRLIAHARGRLARWLPFLRRHAQVFVGDAIGISSGVGSAIGSGYAGWDANATADERLDWLHQETERLGESIRTVDIAHRDANAALRNDLTDTSSRLDAKLTGLQTGIENREQAAANIDAEALPIVGLGILLSGLPDAAVNVTPIAVVLLVVGGIALLFGLFLVRTQWRARRRHAESD